MLLVIMRRRGRPPHPDILTPREWEVLALLRDGLSNEEIAARLEVSPSTAKFHVSEILGKLGLSTRDEAARWQPDRVAGRGFLSAPLAALRRLHLGWPLQLAGGALILAVVAGIGALVWGVVASGGGASSSAGTRSVISAPTPCSQTSSDPAIVVGLVDVGTRTCTAIPSASGISLAQWVRDGQTFVAYDANDHTYKIFDLRGHVLDTIYFKIPTPVDGHLYAWVAPSPDGKTILIVRNVAQAGVYSFNARDVRTGEERTFPALPGVNDTASYSPDGAHVSYANHNGNAEALIIANADGSGPKTLRQVQNPQAYVSPLQWSPDSHYLLIMSDRLEVIDLDGATVWKQSTPPAGRYTWAQWAGPNRLLVQQPQSTDSDGKILPPNAWLVSIPSAVESVADPQLAALDDISPDGHLGTFQCNLFDIDRLTIIPTTGCAYVYDWTADSKLGLYAFGAN